MSNYDDYDYITAHTDEIRLIEKIQIAVAIISTICSASVVFILLYKRSTLLAGRPFILLILMIAIFDMLLSFTYAFGYPKQHMGCAVQGFFGVLFSRASWLYTLGLVLQLAHVVIYRTFLCSNKRMIISIAVINGILQLLPFTTNTYYGGSLGTEVCFFTKGKGTYDQLHIWEILCFFAIQIISFSIIIIVTIGLYIHSKSAGTTPLYQQIENAWTTIILYPLGIYHYFYH